MIRERHTGMFKPGQSGNPAGRPKEEKNIRDLARAHSEEAIITLVEIARNPNSSDAARVQACNALLDRGWGKPTQMSQNLNVNQNYYDFLMEIVEKEKLDAGDSLLD